MSTEFVDRTLTCEDCSQPFTFSAGEQAYYKTKSLASEPKRCPEDRYQRRRLRELRAGATDVDAAYEAKCAKCGRDTTLPFEPRVGREVFCRNCMPQKKDAAARHKER